MSLHSDLLLILILGGLNWFKYLHAKVLRCYSCHTAMRLAHVSGSVQCIFHIHPRTQILLKLALYGQAPNFKVL